MVGKALIFVFSLILEKSFQPSFLFYLDMILISNFTPSKDWGLCLPKSLMLILLGAILPCQLHKLPLKFFLGKNHCQKSHLKISKGDLQPSWSNPLTLNWNNSKYFLDRGYRDSPIPETKQSLILSFLFINQGNMWKPLIYPSLWSRKTCTPQLKMG